MHTTDQPAIALDEHAAAKALNMSLSWIRKDRYGKRLIPFYKIGGAVRYDLERVRASLANVEEGGARPRAR